MIRTWSQSKDATRNVAHPSFARFLAKDFSATLELVTLFDRGLHESSHSLTERQVRLMALRMNQFLQSLLEVRRESGG